MVHFYNSAVAAAAVTSVVLSSLAPGVQAAPAMPPLPMRQEARRSMLKSGDLDLEKRDLKIKGCFDPDHSLHYNYHHGCASEDGHGHGWHGAKERRTIDLEAVIQLNSKAHKHQSSKRGLLGLNLGGNADTSARANSNSNLGLGGILGGGKNGALIGGKNGIGLNLKAKRGEESLEDDEDDSGSSDDETEIEKRDPRSSRSRHRHRHRHGHRHDHDHDHVHIHSHKRDEIEARDPRNHHHHDSDHGHEHVHIHSHSHKRDVEEVDELEKRSKSEPKRFERKSRKSKKNKGGKKSGKSYKKKSSKSKGSSSKKADNKKEAAPASSDPAVSAKVSLGKRGLSPAGVPGFVEVATPLFNSTLARTVAGLVFTANPDPSPNATTFVLGTSDAESTQFYLTTASNPDPSTPTELNVVNIRVPILDSQTLKVVDYCATFDLTPPSPLSLLPCGNKDGFSQNFAYNGTTGEVQPLYSTTPAPMAMVSSKASEAAHSFAATGGNSTSTEPEEEETPEDISLYFIPASTYYEAPADVNHLIDSHKNRTLAATSSSEPTEDEEEMTESKSDLLEPTETSSESTDMPSSTDMPTSTQSSSASDPTMTSAPSSDDSMMDQEIDSPSSSSSMMDDSMMSESMDDPEAYPTDSMMDEETLSTSTVEPSATSTPLVNQNNAAASSTSAPSSMVTSSSVTPSSSGSAPVSSSTMSSSMTSSGASGSASSKSTSASSSASSAAPTVTLNSASSSSSDYTTNMPADPNRGIDANSGIMDADYSPMKMARRRRFARW